MDAKKVRRLLALWERQLGAAWVDALKSIRNEHTLTQLAALLEDGDINGALSAVETSMTRYFGTWQSAYTGTAQQAALFLQRSTGINMSFDGVNQRAITELQRNQLRLVTNFTTQQRNATQAAIQRAFETGANPKEVARVFRGSIGLTPQQERAIANYEEALRTGDARALRNQLRDKRFDASVRRNLRSNRDRTPLGDDKIDRMVGRYRERMLRFRSETIARTESLRAVHQGQDSMFRQAIDSGTMAPDSMERTWNTAGDERVRDPNHTAMHGQKRGALEPFISGEGNQLQYPGDPAAPAKETVQCRCVASTRVVKIESISFA